MTDSLDDSRKCPLILRQAQDERTWGFAANPTSASAFAFALAFAFSFAFWLGFALIKLGPRLPSDTVRPEPVEGRFREQTE
jgi:hypothetical protein